MLAQDLNYYIDAHPKERLVHFIDEYERVFDEGGAGAPWKENPFDAHIRTLIQYSNGLLSRASGCLGWKIPIGSTIFKRPSISSAGSKTRTGAIWANFLPPDKRSFRSSKTFVFGTSPTPEWERSIA